MANEIRDLEIDDGHKALNTLVETHRALVLSNANEANTRAKVIDWTLRRVLGWQDDDLQFEERVTEDGNTTFADYLISTATTLVIVEAKKAGAAFVLPTSVKSSRLGGVLSQGDVGEAIRQARDYCRGRAAQFAAVTNGSAWVVFPAIRTDGVPFEETQGRIFRNLEDIQERFVEFWELLSRQRVIEGSLEHELLAARGGPQGRRPITLLREPEYRLSKNSLYPHIEFAIAKALTDEGISNDPQALRACYIQSVGRTKFDSRLRMYLADAKPLLGRATVRIKARKSREFLDTRIAESVSSPARFFLLLGAVGSGKSTFLNYTRNVSGDDVITGKILWLSVDYKKATEADNPRRFLYSQLLYLIERDETFALGDWEKSIMPAYKDQIDSLARGPLSPIKKTEPHLFARHVSELVMQDRQDGQPYVENIIRNALKARPGFLIVDNVDQIENEQVQNAIFSEVQAAAQRMGLNVIMALRDSTYIKNRNSPTFDAFQFDSIYVDPPSVIPVLSRRLQYAKNLLRGKAADLTLSNGMHLKVDDLSVFFDIVTQSVLTEDAGFMFDVLSGGDIRRGLSLVREFMASGHTTADWALQNYMSDRSYRFPLHEIFKGATLGSRKFYREEESLLPNIFSAKLGTASLQLLRLHLIGYMVAQAQSISFEGTLVEKLVADLHQLGVTESDVDTVLRKLLDTKAIRTSDGAEYTRLSRLLPTRLAGYLLNELTRRFNYAEMCMLDAVIYDEETWKRIVELTAAIQRQRDTMKGVPLRIDRVREFVTYLLGIEERWAIECRRRNLASPWGDQILGQSIFPALEQDFARIVASADRQIVRRQGYSSG